MFATATPTVAHCKSANENMPAAAVVAKMGAGNFDTDDDDDGSRLDPSAAEAARKRGREDEVDSEA